MTTLLVSENFPPKVGGSSRYCWEIYRRLPQADFLVAAGADPDQESVDHLGEVRTRRLPLTFPTRFIRRQSLPHYKEAFSRLRDLVVQEQVRVIHAARCLHEGLLALAVKRATGVEYSCIAHGEEINPSNSEPNPRWYRRRVYNSREMALMVGLVLRGASHVIASNRNARSILVDRWGVPSQRVHLLHPGVDTGQFSPHPPDPVVRERLGWRDRRVVLTVGRLQKRKGHDVLISALPEIRRMVPEVLYAIVGDGEERQSLQRLAREKGLEDHVQFLLEVDEQRLIECYQQCDLFVLPNREIDGDIEGFGIVLLEAQACGRPVVAGASGGTAETMSIGATGFVVPCDGPAALSALLQELLADADRRESMGQAARGWAVERFDWQSLAEQARRLFSELR